MRIYGITGGIASGKSTVAALFRAKGAAVLDGDQVAREVVAPGQPAYQEIITAFGEKILLPDGGIDRKRLGALVFSDHEKRKRLEAITHPKIAARTTEELNKFREAGAAIAFYEATLLVETRAYEWLNGLIVVQSDPSRQIERAMARDGAEQIEVEKRIAAQVSNQERAAHATYIVDTNGSLEQTKQQVDQIWAALIAATASP